MILLIVCFTVLLHLMKLPWWLVLVLIPVLFLLSPKGEQKPFLKGFFALFTAWFITAFWISWQNGHILASKVAGLFFVQHWLVLVLATALLGGLLGGVAALAGHCLRQLRAAPAALAVQG